MVLKGNEVPEWYLKLESEIIEINRLKSELDARSKKLQTTILSMMEAEKADAISTDLTSASRSKPTECRRFDTERFKAENETMYSDYCKIFNRSASVTLKVLSEPKS